MLILVGSVPNTEGTRPIPTAIHSNKWLGSATDGKFEQWHLSAALPVVQVAQAHSKMFLGRLYCRMSHHKSVSHRRLYSSLPMLMTLHRHCH